MQAISRLSLKNLNFSHNINNIQICQFFFELMPTFPISISGNYPSLSTYKQTNNDYPRQTTAYVIFRYRASKNLHSNRIIALILALLQDTSRTLLYKIFKETNVKMKTFNSFNTIYANGNFCARKWPAVILTGTTNSSALHISMLLSAQLRSVCFR